MNGVHDMGGMHGFGPIEREHDEPVFHHRWEARTFALRQACGALGKWNIDMPGMPTTACGALSSTARRLALLLDERKVSLLAAHGIAVRTRANAKRRDQLAIASPCRLLASLPAVFRNTS